jgi:hypothetical protein
MNSIVEQEYPYIVSPLLEKKKKLIGKEAIYTVNNLERTFYV